MKNYARLVADVAVDVSTKPDEHFHPDLAGQFIEVPLEVAPGWRALGGGKWQPPPPPEPLPPVYPVVSPVAFKQLFTLQERVAIRACDNPLVVEFFALIDDQRTEQIGLGSTSTQQVLELLEDAGIINDERKAQILAGTPT